MVFMAFLAAFGLGIFIGLAGPPITEETEVTAKQILATTNVSRGGIIPSVASGPFLIKSQFLTTYNQQLWVIAKLWTSNTDDELYDKSFKVNVAIDGVTKDHKTETVLHTNMVRNR